jgi:DNA-directed RNA polymerase II subunit RPB1
MNVHIPQDEDSRVELSTLSTATQNLISPQSSKPAIYIIQDSLVAAYMMTKYNKKIAKKTFFDIIMKAEKLVSITPLKPITEFFSPDYILKRIVQIEKILKENKKEGVFNGRGLISMLLPENLDYSCKNNADEKEPIVKIVKGVLIEGAFNKTIVGPSHTSLIQHIYKYYSKEESMNFVDNIQIITNAWMLQSGFSIGIRDCIMTEKMDNDYIDKTINSYFVEAKTVEQTTQNEKIKEAKITGILNKARDLGTRIAKESLDPDNNFLKTIISGTKGDYFNLAQITGLLGQQNVAGERVNLVFNKGRRSLPHYSKDIKNIKKQFESRGFIRSSLLKGLNPQEFFFHAMSGREGVINTALSTANSGYIQRRMIKILEDVQVRYDGTVRNSSGSILQWAYGEDGLDRSETIVMGNKIELCDVSILANSLNSEYEKEIKNT